MSIEDLQKLCSEYKKLKKFHEECKMAYYAPPLDIPPTSTSDMKITCRDFKRALDNYER